MLSEKKAWLKVAEIWSEEDVGMHNYNGEDSLFVKWGGGKLCGLCPTIELMYEKNLISWATVKKMMDKIQKQAPTQNAIDTFIWPETEEGRQARVAFCLEQARLLEETVHENNTKQTSIS